MSEWKMCLDCHHGYKQHTHVEGGFGKCLVEGCDCPWFYNEVENF